MGCSQVSQLLSHCLHDAYCPTKNWRSSLRTRLYPDIKLPPKEHPGSPLPFEILDGSGCKAMTRFLIKQSFAPAKDWKKNPPLYHIAVSTTEKSRSDPVEIAAHQLTKVRPFITTMPFKVELSNAYVLVFNRHEYIESLQERNHQTMSSSLFSYLVLISRTKVKLPKQRSTSIHGKCTQTDA